jgi:hypothetical protein
MRPVLPLGAMMLQLLLAAAAVAGCGSCCWLFCGGAAHLAGCQEAIRFDSHVAGMHTTVCTQLQLQCFQERAKSRRICLWYSMIRRAECIGLPA